MTELKETEHYGNANQYVAYWERDKEQPGDTDFGREGGKVRGYAHKAHRDSCLAAMRKYRSGDHSVIDQALGSYDETEMLCSVIQKTEDRIKNMIYHIDNPIAQKAWREAYIKALEDFLYKSPMSL